MKQQQIIINKQQQIINNHQQTINNNQQTINNLQQTINNQLIEFCLSDSLSEDGLREILERFNNNLNIDHDLFLVVCRNKKVTEGIILCFLEYFPDAVRHTDGIGLLPLHMICNNKNATRGMVQLIIDACPDSIDRGDNDGWTPLHYLCSNKTLEDTAALDILGLLLERCPEAAQRAAGGALPIHAACGIGLRSPEFCRMLIEAYPGSVRIADSTDGVLPLHIACREGAVVTSKYLYKLYPESINVATRDGAYPIHYAIMRLTGESPATAIEMVQFLLDRDLNISSQKFHGRFSLVTIFNIACNNRNNPSKFNAAMKIFHLLYDAHPEAIEDNEITSNIERRVVPREIQTYINTQLTYALQARGRTLMNTPDVNGQLPLHRALCDNVTIGSIKLLVKGNRDAVQISDNSGSLPLHLASQHHESTKVVDYLAGLDSDTLTAVDTGGNTALHHACRGTKYDTISLLLEKYGAVSVSKTNGHNKLPIHLLLESGGTANREDDTQYMESIFRLLRAYPDTPMMSENIEQQQQQSNIRQLHVSRREEEKDLYS